MKEIDLKILISDLPVGDNLTKKFYITNGAAKQAGMFLMAIYSGYYDICE